MEKLESLISQVSTALQSSKFADAEHLAIDALELLETYNSEALFTSDSNRYADYKARLLLNLSGTYWSRGMGKEILPIANDLLTLSKEFNNREIEAKAYNSFGIAHFILSDYYQALDFHTRALEIMTELGNKDGIIRNAGNIANIYKNQGDFSKSIEFYNISISLAKEIGNKSNECINIGNIGLVYLLQAEYALALEYFLKALAMDTEIGNKSGIARHLGNIGNVYYHLSDYGKALEYYTQALHYNEEINDISGIARMTGNIGLLHFTMNELSVSLEYFYKALEVAQELGSKDEIGRFFNHIGNVYQESGAYQDALEYFGRALSIFEEIGNKYGISEIYANLGNVFELLHDFGKSIEYFKKALALSEELGSTSNIALFKSSIGRITANPDSEFYNFNRAEELISNSISVFNELGEKLNLCKLHQVFAVIYKSHNKWEEFALHFEKYHNLEKEIQSEETKKQLQRIDFERKIAEYDKRQAVERADAQATERILNNILPVSIATRLKNGEQPISNRHDNVSVIFIDIVGFTRLTSNISPERLIELLNTIFSEFDHIAEKYGLEKIKTIGDAYMAVSGAPEANNLHALRVANFAVDALGIIDSLQSIHDIPLQIRIGLHCGNVIAGVIGKQKFAYDMWGEAINTAARMESHGEPGKIHISNEFKDTLSALIDINGTLDINCDFTFTERGAIKIKGKGEMRTFFMERG